MKQNQNPEEVFRLLENADDETILHLSEHYLSAAPDEMEKIFARSEQKYELKTQMQTPEPEAREPAVTVKTVRNTGFCQSIFAAAACLIVTVSAVNGILKLQVPPVMKTNSVVEILDMSETLPETTGVPVFEQYIPENTEPSADTVITETSVMTEQPATAGTTSETTVFTTPETTQTTVSVPDTATVWTETVLQPVTPATEMFETESAAVSVLPEMTEMTETTVSETEPLPEMTETTVTTAGTEPETSSEIPGFLVEIVEYEGITEKYDHITAVPDADAPETFGQEYEPAWLPDGYVLTDTAKSFVSGTEIEMLHSRIYQNQEKQKVMLHQFIQTYFSTELAPSEEFVPSSVFSGILFRRSVLTVGSNPGFCYQESIYSNGAETLNGWMIYWKQDGYVMNLETYTLSFEEAVKIAESVRPVQEQESF